MLALAIIALAQPAGAFDYRPDLGSRWLLGKARNLGVIISQDAGGGGGGGQDFSDDAACVVFYSFEGADATASKEDYCTGTDQDLTETFAPDPGRQTTCGDANSAGTVCYEDDGAADSDDWHTADHADFDVTSITINARVYLDDLGTVARTIVSKFDAGTGFRLLMNSSEQVECQVGTANTTSTATLSVDTWYSISCRHSNSQSSGAVQLYINGSIDCGGGCATDASVTYGNAVDLIVGGATVNSTWDGRLNDVAIYNSYMSTTEMCQVADFGFLGTDTDRNHGGC